MMSIYLDKRFVDDFNKRTDLENEVVEDFHKIFMRRARGVEITVNLETAEELKKLSEVSRFYADLLEINPSIILNPNWESEIINPANICEGNPTKLFLHSNTEDCEALQKKYGLLFINNKNLIEKWQPVRYEREISELTPENSNSFYSFHSWEVLKNVTHPFQELLILDLFLLEDKANQRLTNNIIPLIKIMQVTQQRRIRVVVFTDRVLKSPDGKKYQKLEEAFERLHSAVNDIDICIVHYDKESKTSYQKNSSFLSEHDRELYTNYLKLKSGSGWNLFDERNKISGNRTTISIQSMFRNDVRNSAKKAFENLKVYKEQINKGVEKLVYGQKDENGNFLKSKEYLQFPVAYKSILLRC